MEQYQRYNEALKDVQDQFIAGHRELASGVMETEYENGKKVVVNYNRKEYSLGQITVPAMDYIVIEGGRNNEAFQKIKSIFIGQIGRLTVSFSLVGWFFCFYGFSTWIFFLYEL